MRKEVILILFVLFGIIGCVRSEFEFKNAEIIDIRVFTNGGFAVIYSSNETVNVYSFSKLVTSFTRKSVFASIGGTNTLGSYYKVSDFGFLRNGVFYLVGYKPTLGWVVKIGNSDSGYYSYVSEFSCSENGKMVGYIYNVGGEYDGTNVYGGKYYVNVNGVDYGPYDFAKDLLLFEDEGVFVFSFKQGRNYRLKVGDYEYSDYDYVMLPRNMVRISEFNFIYKVGRDWFLYPDERLPREVFGFVMADNEYFLLLSNSNFTIVTNPHTNFLVEGRVLDIVGSGKYLVLSEVSDGKKLMFDRFYGSYQDITKYEVRGNKLVFKYKSNDQWYVYGGVKSYGPFELVDFAVVGNKIFIGYVEKGRVKLMSEKLE
ncbi:MAG: hypothetical protein ABDH28_03850 [Brevinematia bacterium]